MNRLWTIYSRRTGQPLATTLREDMARELVREVRGLSLSHPPTPQQRATRINLLTEAPQ